MKQQEDTREAGTPLGVLRLQFSSTPRGARLARTLAVQQVMEWSGDPYDSDTVSAVGLITAELAANAITHGRLPGRDFRLTVLLLTGAVRIEVTDARPERLLAATAPRPADLHEVAGRGLVLVEAHAARWGCVVCDAYTKCVWAEVPCGT
ncbi:ATP-binding protein [Streptomyces sp. BE230]|uniref:ATP-binding protein n=1 Tax=Streptomyces sp. BE230 TaxID=3002526 RepID=UPI002ED64F73|nr:ATP-binding protein [Streptomyces sp. BE230]